MQSLSRRPLCILLPKKLEEVGRILSSSLEDSELESDRRNELMACADIARRQFDKFKDGETKDGKPLIVRESIPVLFFGDYRRYCKSKLKIVTSGLNPSSSEFPDDNPYSRFRGGGSIGPGQNEKYLNCLGRYFETNPYDAWFDKSFLQMLLRFNTSYYFGSPGTSTALHIDFCSPLATTKSWGELGKFDSASARELEADGNPLWYRLVNALAPDIVLMSQAKDYQRKILEHYRKRPPVMGRFRRIPEETACWSQIRNRKTVLVWARYDAKNRCTFGISWKEKKAVAEQTLLICRKHLDYSFD